MGSCVTKRHSSVGLIVGFAHPLLIASSVTADLDGLRIKAKGDLQREAMPFTASTQLIWLRQPATVQAKEPCCGLFTRGENNSGSHRLMALQLLLLFPVCHFSTKLISLLGGSCREMQDGSQPAAALQALLGLRLSLFSPPFLSLLHASCTMTSK